MDRCRDIKEEVVGGCSLAKDMYVGKFEEGIIII